MNWTEKLNDKLSDNTAIIGIVGLGYVGLPLATAFSRKYKVIGYNRTQEKTEQLKMGKSYIEDVADDDINLEMLHPTNDHQELAKCDFIIITVPTPLREDKSPDLSYVKHAGEEVGNILRKGQFVILKSTTYPGTTEEFLTPVLEEKSGLTAGTDFGVGYSPERVDPGNKEFCIDNTPNVVGGLNPEFTEICAKLFEGVTGDVIRVKDCKTAEAVKMIENIYRNVNIALANELALIFEKMDIDIWEALEAAKTKPFGFTPFYPGPGVGGHCIPLDPYYLSYRAKHFGIIPRFIETAGEINDFMPIHTVNLVRKGLMRAGKKLRGSRILVLGISYKANISDTRESPAANVIEELVENGGRIIVYDPYAESIKTRLGTYRSEKSLEEHLNQVDCLVILADHNEFRKNQDLISSLEKGVVVVDTKNALDLKEEDVPLYVKI